MRVRSLTNISSATITVMLSNGSLINLPPTGMLTEVDITNLSGIKKFVKVVYSLND